MITGIRPYARYQQLAALKCDDFPGFPWMHLLENSAEGPVPQIALAEQLLQRERHRIDLIVSSANPLLPWLQLHSYRMPVAFHIILMTSSRRALNS